MRSGSACVHHELELSQLEPVLSQADSRVLGFFSAPLTTLATISSPRTIVPPLRRPLPASPQMVAKINRHFQKGAPPHGGGDAACVVGDRGVTTEAVAACADAAGLGAVVGAQAAVVWGGSRRYGSGVRCHPLPSLLLSRLKKNTSVFFEREKEHFIF